MQLCFFAALLQRINTLIHFKHRSLRFLLAQQEQQAPKRGSVRRESCSARTALAAQATRSPVRLIIKSCTPKFFNNSHKSGIWMPGEPVINNFSLMRIATPTHSHSHSHTYSHTPIPTHTYTHKLANESLSTLSPSATSMRQSGMQSPNWLRISHARDRV